MTIPEPANSTEDATPNPSSSDRGECGICGERVAKLAKHMRKFHEDDVAAAGKRSHNCRECDTNFNTDEDLDAHRLIYTDIQLRQVASFLGSRGSS